MYMWYLLNCLPRWGLGSPTMTIHPGEDKNLIAQFVGLDVSTVPLKAWSSSVCVGSLKTLYLIAAVQYHRNGADELASEHEGKQSKGKVSFFYVHCFGFAPEGATHI